MLAGRTMLLSALRSTWGTLREAATTEATSSALSACTSEGCSRFRRPGRRARAAIRLSSVCSAAVHQRLQPDRLGTSTLSHPDDRVRLATMPARVLQALAVRCNLQVGRRFQPGRSWWRSPGAAGARPWPGLPVPCSWPPHASPDTCWPPPPAGRPARADANSAAALSSRACTPSRRLTQPWP